MSLIGCGTTTQQVVSKIQIQKVKIPKELLTLSPLEKPQVKNELDIINAYSLLFYKYKQCEIQINKIKELNED
ncbi:MULTISPECIES: Rz1-like lysis system protein LysC [Campylobacter]|uniref:Rz1-like lysis system protein LysC n=1 Tax=Campylobacter TaxID=194 RepID=UPI00301DB7D8